MEQVKRVRPRRVARSLAVGIVGAALVAGLSACKPIAITASSSVSGTVPVGSAVRISGSVTPARPGGTVVLERFVNGTWSSRGTARLSGSSTYVLDATLTQVATYELRVRRAGGDGDAQGISPTITIVSADVPGAPTNLRLSQTSPNSVRATFQAPASNGSPIQGYEVSTGGVTSYCGGTACDIGGLEQQRVYDVRVRAFNGIGAGAWSPSRSIVLNPIPQVTIAKGAMTSQPDCSAAACRWISVQMDDLGGAPYSLRCQSTVGGGWSDFFSGTVANPDNWCYFGYPGEQVRVIVDGVYSNVITW
ncbi:MAG: fibronectin type III domain-containing protein [Acidimicrobiales bacterium]|nr:fibronectin type III domain-containing protein [Acidimicrobiales bacterium]